MSHFQFPKWDNYKRNDMMEKYGENVTKDNILLSRDANNNKKKFNLINVSNFESLGDYLENNDMHLYEILPPEEPLKLYFDLEMENFEENFKETCDNFIKWIVDEIKNVFSITIDIKSILILDSCREKKLSYHVVFTKQIYFAKMADLKSFISYLSKRFENPESDGEAHLIEKLTWYYRNEQKRFIFDHIPYGKFQNFRFCGQSKMAKPYILKIEKSTTYINGTFKGSDAWIRIYNKESLNALFLCSETKWKSKIFQPPATTSTIDDGTTLRNTETKWKKSSKKADLTSSHQKNKSQERNWANFQNKGKTLQQHKNIALEQLEKIPFWKQCLYLIPNPECGQTWNTWRNVGFAIANCGGTKKDWEDWSKLATLTYKDGETNDFEKFRCEYDGFGKDKNTNFNITSLYKLAKYARPDYFKGKIPSFDTYFQIDYSGVKLIEEDSPFVSEGSNNILTPTKFIIISAYLGKGKTTACKRLIKHFKYKKILILSSRQSFANFMASEFEIPCYLDDEMTTDATLNEKDKLVISIESLRKLNNTNAYDLILIDESESILAQLSSPTLNGHLNIIYKTLREFLKNSKKVVLADAFLTRRTVDFARSFLHQEDTEITLLKNNSLPVKREAISLDNKARFSSDLMKSVSEGYII
jgi:hypothetical protein